MKLHLFTGYLLFSLITIKCTGQEIKSGDISYQKACFSLKTAIEQHFYDPQAGFYREHIHPQKDQNRFSYLWPLCALIQADNEIEKLTGDTGLVNKTLNIIQKYYDTTAPVPGYDSYIVNLGGGDKFYDDNQWIGLALMEAYFGNKDQKYLNISKQIYRFMMTGFDTVTGGGLYWKEGDYSSKNTCSNGPGILLALKLYKVTKQKKYLDTALLLYHWVNAKLKAPSGLYYDNIKTKTGKIDKHIYSYNTGTMLEANVYLYELTKDTAYLKKAIDLANVSSAYFLGKGKFRDGYWFNAVLLRAYQHLLKVNPNRKYINMFKKCVDHALTYDRNSNGLMGKDKIASLVDQAGMVEILARLSY